LRDSPEYVLVASSACSELDGAGVWDAVKILEIHPAAAVVGGRLLNPSDVVVECGRVPDALGRLASPFAGLTRTDPGPFAMALKAHRILCPADSLFVARTTFVARALERQPAVLDRAQLATWLAACAIADGATIAYSPLLQARTRADEPHVPTDTDQTFQRMLDALGASFAPQSVVIGVASLVKAKAFANHANDGTPAALAPPPRQRLEPVSP
jgi:hypothetical protein